MVDENEFVKLYVSFEERLIVLYDLEKTINFLVAHILGFKGQL